MPERRHLGLVDMDTIRLADRCAARVGLRLGEHVSRVGVVRIALAELADKLDEADAGGAAEGGESGG